MVSCVPPDVHDHDDVHARAIDAPGGAQLAQHRAMPCIDHNTE